MENKNEGGETPLISVWVQSSVTVYSGSQEQGDEELLWNTLLANVGDTTSTHLMTLRLNTEAGKHRAFKGETKLDN